MRHIHVIGIGPGNPDHASIAAVEAMRSTDVFFVLDKGEEKADLHAARTALCERHLAPGTYRWVEVTDPARDRDPADYDAEVARWHRARADRFAETFATELGDDGIGAFLVWGDPSLYDSTLRILDDLHAQGTLPFTHDVVPGVTSVAALAAAHRIPLHRIGESVLITTGRRLRDDHGWPQGVANVVVMLDGDCSFQHLDPTGVEIWWGAYLGTPMELLAAGPLAQVGPDIQETRARARAEHGWIMDTYLLRRTR
ncbi:MAG TPA: precorrin-6A synthase (deacetylating) [Acidimicrobiales bacterium]|nr:precorrin-6A synthase (deacetylating) [Acidimicrobiales bacterium]